jgi:hypothetical protein
LVYFSVFFLPCAPQRTIDFSRTQRYPAAIPKFIPELLNW